MKRADAWLRSAGRRCLLDPRDSTLRRRSAPGGARRGGPKYELLYPLLDITTTLDPYFNIAYRFGAIFLGEPYPGGPGRPDQAVALLRKGIAAMPHKWEYYHDVAFVYYWRLHDYKAAAQWFQRAAAQPKAPNWLPAGRRPCWPAATTGQPRGSCGNRLLHSEQAWVRRTAERSLAQFEALDQIDQLQAIVSRTGRPPGRYSWPALIGRGDSAACLSIPQGPLTRWTPRPGASA